MTSFTIQSLTTLLSWVSTAARAIWAFLSRPEGSAAGQWLLAYWKELLAVILLVGILADALVYLFHWQPWRVWASFIRRHRHSKTSVSRKDGSPAASANSDLQAGLSTATKARLRVTALLDRLTEDEPATVALPYRAPMRSKEDAFHEPYIPEERQTTVASHPERHRRKPARGSR